MGADTSVFVSYTADAKPYAEELVSVLEQEGIPSWVDFRDLQPGQRWRNELDEALKNAESFLILVGPEGRTSRWLDFEWQAALAAVWSGPGKRLIPVVLGGAESPPFLREWVSLKVDPANEASVWTRRVLDALRAPKRRHGRKPDAAERRQRAQRLSEIERAAELLDNCGSGPL